jgi:methionyl-tRNA formyltransferase
MDVGGVAEPCYALGVRLVFMGSPEFAVPSLKALARALPVVGVVTQPDRPAGRGRPLRPPAVKTCADLLGLPSVQPERVQDPALLDQVRDWAPDLIVVAAYGQILRTPLLELPPLGCVNVHASLLPRWRGAAPVQAAIMAGDTMTGVTIMQMDAGMDTGPILSQREVPINQDDTGSRLSERLAGVGAALLMETLPGYLNGEIEPIPQDDSRATHAPLLRKVDGEMDFTLPATALARHIRAYDPWPGSFFLWQGLRFAVRAAHAAPSTSLEPGRVLLIDRLPAVTTGEGALVLDLIQPAGKRVMTGAEFARGAPRFLEARLSPPAGLL